MLVIMPDRPERIIVDIRTFYSVLHGFSFFLESSEKLVPNDKRGAVIFINVNIIPAMMYTVQGRGDQYFFQKAKFGTVSRVQHKIIDAGYFQRYHQHQRRKSKDGQNTPENNPVQSL